MWFHIQAVYFSIAVFFAVVCFALAWAKATREEIPNASNVTLVFVYAAAFILAVTIGVLAGFFWPALVVGFIAEQITVYRRRFHAKR